MLTRVVVQLVGLVLSIGPLFLLLFRLLKDGWRTTFQDSSRRRRPAALEDSKHGEHGYVKGNLEYNFIFPKKIIFQITFTMWQALEGFNCIMSRRVIEQNR